MNRWVYWFWAMFLATITLVAALSVTSYGVSWDEIFRSNAGDQKLAYYAALLSGETDQASELRNTVDRYPGLFDILNALLRRILPFDDYLVGHGLSMLFGLFGILGTMLLGRQCFGPWAGLCAGLALVCSMRYWGHMFINPKDIPFAATFVWGLWAWMRVLDRQKLRYSSALLFGLFLGACLSVRIGGLLLIAYAGLFLGLVRILRWSQDDRAVSSILSELMSLFRWLSLSGLVGFIVLALFWPALHSNPFGTTASTISSVSDFEWEGIVRYGGEWLRVNDLPSIYFLQWLSMTLPDLWNGILAVALLVLVVRWRRGDPLTPAGRVAAARLGCLLVMILFPLLYIWIRGSTVYDGVRHILFLLPIMAVCVGFFMVWVFASLRPNRMFRVAWCGLVALGVGTSAIDGLRLHPYQYVYFNRLSGGLAEKGSVYEHDYWGTAFREGTEWLSANLPSKPDGRLWRLTMQPPVETLVRELGKPVVPPPSLVQPFLREDIQLVAADEDPELYIASTRTAYHTMREGAVLHEVRRSGIVLLQVKSLTGFQTNPRMSEKSQTFHAE